MSNDTKASTPLVIVRTRVIAVAVGDNFGVCLGHSSREHEDRECHHPTTRQVATAAGRTAPCLCVCGVPGQWRDLTRAGSLSAGDTNQAGGVRAGARIIGTNRRTS